MIPDEVALTGYRGFESRQVIALRPLTLLYGRNNAGKSALLRALPLLSDSIVNAGTDVLAVSSPAARGGGFRDISFDGRPEGFAVEWWWAAARRRVIIELKLFPDWGRTVIGRFSVLEDAKGDGSEVRPLLTATWTPRREERESPRLSYDIDPAGRASFNAPIAFRGHIPQLDGDLAALPEIALAATLLRGLGGEVQWIEAARRRPERALPEPLGPRWRLDPSGSDAVVAMRSIASVERAVSAWFERRAQRRVVTSDAGPGTFFTAVEAVAGDRRPHSIADLGEGMIQVLPVLTAMELARRHRDGGAAILAVEEPESNLHPAFNPSSRRTFVSSPRRPSPRVS